MERAKASIINLKTDMQSFLNRCMWHHCEISYNFYLNEIFLDCGLYKVLHFYCRFIQVILLCLDDSTLYLTWLLPSNKGYSRLVASSKSTNSVWYSLLFGGNTRISSVSGKSYNSSVSPACFLTAMNRSYPGMGYKEWLLTTSIRRPAFRLMVRTGAHQEKNCSH